MPTVATNMLIGDRPEPFMKYALLSTRWVDEKVIVNTGSKDSDNIKMVKEILPEAKIIQFSGTFTFSAARNLAMQNTQSQWIIHQDMDECHFDMFEGLVRNSILYSPGDGIQFAFHHFILDFFHYQSIDPRVILFKKEGKRWVGDVHEHVTPFNRIVCSDYVYHHYGYVKPQKDIYENWKLYWSLTPGERWKCNEYRNPDDIISDRVSVAHEYKGRYPEVIQEYINTQKPIIKDYKFL